MIRRFLLICTLIGPCTAAQLQANQAYLQYQRTDRALAEQGEALRWHEDNRYAPSWSQPPSPSDEE